MNVLYKRTKTINGDFVTRTKCFYYNPANSKKQRAVRLCKTGESKQKRNDRTAFLKSKYDIYNNFVVGDLWGTLTYRDITDTETADKILMNVIGKVQRVLKRKNIPFVYYIKTEAAEGIRPHHHLIIKNTSTEILGLLLKYWKQYGNIKDFKEIYSITDNKLITYFLNGGNHKELDFEKFHHSRNLVHPEVEKRIYPANSFRVNPKPPKADDESYHYEIRDLFNGYPDIDGYTYQEYTLIKVKEVKKE